MLLRSMPRRILENSDFYPPSWDAPIEGEIIWNTSPPFSLYNMIDGVDSGGRASSTWQSINDPLAFPFVLPKNATAYQLVAMNGTAAGGNFDLGIYDSSFARIVSTGSTGGVTNSVAQFVDITDTLLLAGKQYYLAYVRDDITANRIQRVSMGSAPTMGLCGVQTTTTDSIPLPDPLSGMGVVTATFTIIPLCGIALRSSPL